MQRLAPDARPLFAAAEQEARERHSAQVEAEHLLLALARSGTAGADVLTGAGLDHEHLVDALAREREASLAAAGVGVDVDAFGTPTAEPGRRIRLGASFKASMERSVVAARGSKQIQPAHLLVGVLGAELGTVPRALRLAEVDVDELARRARAAA